MGLKGRFFGAKFLHFKSQVFIIFMKISGLWWTVLQFFFSPQINPVKDNHEYNIPLYIHPFTFFRGQSSLLLIQWIQISILYQENVLNLIFLDYITNYMRFKSSKKMVQKGLPHFKVFLWYFNSERIKQNYKFKDQKALIRWRCSFLTKFNELQCKISFLTFPYVFWWLNWKQYIMSKGIFF